MVRTAWDTTSLITVENKSVLRGSPWGRPSHVLDGLSAVGLLMIVGLARRTLTTSSQAGQWGQSFRRVSMHVLRCNVPKAFLKSRLAITCVGLAASRARMDKVMANPPWGVPMPNCFPFRKGSRSGLAWARSK